MYFNKFMEVKMPKNLTEEQKSKILKDVFKDQMAELRIFAVEDMLTSGHATDFESACEKLKMMEDEKYSSEQKDTVVLSEQEKSLIKALSEFDNE